MLGRAPEEYVEWTLGFGLSFVCPTILSHCVSQKLIKLCFTIHNFEF